MTDQQMGIMKSLLENQLELLEGKITILGIGVCADENEFASRVTEAYARVAENERTSALIAEIREALELIRHSRYGQCRDCGRDIGWKRLRARPMAQRCVDCQEERERCAA